MRTLRTSDALLRALALVSLVAPLSCISCKTDRTGSLELVTGGESQVLTRAPAVTTLRADLVADSGDKTTLYSGSATPGSLDLGSFDGSLTGSLSITGAAADGAVVVRGSSLSLQLGSLDQQNIRIFVQRTGELARMPSTFDERAAPMVDLVLGRYLFATAKGTTQTSYYDLLTFSPPSQTSPTLPRAPDTVVVVSSVALLINGDGASAIDLSTGDTTQTVSAPAGGTFAEVAGGHVVYAPDGTAYVIGGTRSGSASQRFLRVSSSTLTWGTLSTPRLGAGATWVDGRGVFVVAGSATGAGAEIIAAEATQGAPLPFPSDARAGAAAAPLDAGRVFVAPASAVYDLSCTVGCSPEAWATLPMPVSSAQTFTFRGDATRAWTVADDLQGNTHVFVNDKAKAQELPLKLPRARARGVPLPTGALAIVGGGSQTIESLLP